MFKLKTIDRRYEKEIGGNSYPVMDVTAIIDNKKTKVTLATRGMVARLFTLSEEKRQKIVDSVYSFVPPCILEMQNFKEIEKMLDTILC